MTYLPTPVKLIQRFSITLPSGGAGTTDTATYTLPTAVNLNNAFPIFLGGQGPGGSYSNFVRVELTNSTTVTASHLRDQAVTVIGLVVELASGLLALAVQKGTISMAGGAGSNTATITSATVAKSLLLHLGTEAMDTTGAGSPAYTAVTLDQTNATTLTVTRANLTGLVKTGYAIVTFN